MSLPETCPFCGSEPYTTVSGEQCRVVDRWVMFSCDTSIYAWQDLRRTQSRKCEVSERNRMLDRVAELEARCKRLEEAGKMLDAAANAAEDDIRQHLQVANYNLHGLLNTGDRIEPPNPPQTIHQAGIDASVSVRHQVRLARQSWRQAKEAKP